MTGVQTCALPIFDTWRGSSDQEGPDYEALQSSYGGVWRSFLYYIRNEKVNDLITPMCLPSVEAAKYFEDNSVYMVFIDGQHTYEAVKSDILAWQPKLQRGGILAGHDYTQEAPDTVKKAVDELIPANALIVQNGCWICRKAS